MEIFIKILCLNAENINLEVHIKTRLTFMLIALFFVCSYTISCGTFAHFNFWSSFSRSKEPAELLQIFFLCCKQYICAPAFPSEPWWLQVLRFTPSVFQASTNDVASDRSGLSPTPRLLGHFSANFHLSFIHFFCSCAVI